jgi:hypothetical protein
VPRIVGAHPTRMGESCRRIYSPLFAPRVRRIVGTLVYNNGIIQ